MLAFDPKWTRAWRPFRLFSGPSRNCDLRKTDLLGPRSPVSFGWLELKRRLEEDFGRLLGKGWAMKMRFGILFIASALIAAPAAAQEDATNLLAAANQAMGASNLNSLHISGAGWYAPLGQNFSPEEH